MIGRNGSAFEGGGSVKSWVELVDVRLNVLGATQEGEHVLALIRYGKGTRRDILRASERERHLKAADREERSTRES